MSAPRFRAHLRNHASGIAAVSRKPLNLGHAVVLLVVAVVIGGGAFAVAAIPGPDGTIKACLKKSGSAKGAVRIIDHNKNCSTSERTLSWNQNGPTGLAGAAGQNGQQGAKGDQGIQGLKGDQGIQGLKGDQGIQGLKGDQGTSGQPGSPSASAMMGQATGLPATTVNQAVAPSGLSTATALTSADAVTFKSPNTTIVASDLSAELTVAPGSGAARLVTVRVNANQTSVTCTISNTATACQSPAGTSTTIPPNSDVTLAVSCTGTPAAASLRFGWRAGTP